MRVSDPALSFIIVIAIGIIAGVVFDRIAGPGWLARQFTGPRGLVTTALIGVAGAFVGFHLALLLGMGGGALVLYIAAALGAAAILFVWRAIR
jgi:uncharacterized membrane protein YeaQ/YmgE (transglycosylase-associated protein family)